MSLPQGYNYDPLPSGLSLGYSDIDGFGTHSTRSIEAGEVFFDRETHTQLPGEDGQLLRSGLGAFINHSDDPNCTLYKSSPDDNGVVQYFLQSLRLIYRLEEITLDYGAHLCGCENSNKLK
ncbi:MAG TPA: hypothetical protein DCW93_09270 [Saprospirales bacterium]|nr:hypothetical protein [Saprospirales bacterium]